jgi:D-sedoheptulose 7-phosphate isomerase
MMRTIKDILHDRMLSRIELYNALLTDHTPFMQTVENAAKLVQKTIVDKKKILIFGNGGSASQASHFAAEFINRFYFDRGTLAAIALTTDISVISSIANDSNFDKIFSRQIKALGESGDTVIGLTTSGESKNVLNGLSEANKSGISSICFCGKNIQNLIKSKTDIIIQVNSDDTPMVQEIHLFTLHFIAEIIEKKLFGGIK